MTKLIDFKDAVNAGVLDPGATNAVYYMDGRYANRAAVAARCPHAILHAITVRGATGPHVFACDSEAGDLTIQETEAWVAEQIRLNVDPIVVYADEDRWINLGLLDALAHYGTRIERWDADYDGSPTIPPWASAKQYATGDVDLDAARAAFFAGPPPPPAPDPMHYHWYPDTPLRVEPQTSLIERWVVIDYDHHIRHPVRYRRRLKRGRAHCAELAARLDTMAEDSGDPAKFLSQYHRGWRRRMLDRRARGQRITG
jgi:hypothetical protein